MTSCANLSSSGASKTVVYRRERERKKAERVMKTYRRSPSQRPATHIAHQMIHSTSLPYSPIISDNYSRGNTLHLVTPFPRKITPTTSKPIETGDYTYNPHSAGKSQQFPHQLHFLPRMRTHTPRHRGLCATPCCGTLNKQQNRYPCDRLFQGTHKKIAERTARCC